MTIQRVKGRLVVSSWTTGPIPVRELSFVSEAKRSPVAVINRLMRQNRFDLAEWVMDNFMQFVKA